MILAYKQGFFVTLAYKQGKQFINSTAPTKQIYQNSLLKRTFVTPRML